jgi:hypothetical protein
MKARRLEFRTFLSVKNRKIVASNEIKRENNLGAFSLKPTNLVN